jgi:hypothetical protein
MSVSGINATDLSALNTTNVQADNQIYKEDSQALSETVQPNLSTASAPTVLPPISPLLDSAPPTLDFRGSPPADNTAPAPPNSLPAQPEIVSATTSPQDMSAPADVSVALTTLAAIQVEAQRAYATLQEGTAGDEGDASSALGDLVA